MFHRPFPGPRLSLTVLMHGCYGLPCTARCAKLWLSWHFDIQKKHLAFQGVSMLFLLTSLSVCRQGYRHTDDFATVFNVYMFLVVTGSGFFLLRCSQLFQFAMVVSTMRTNFRNVTEIFGPAEGITTEILPCVHCTHWARVCSAASGDAGP